MTQSQTTTLAGSTVSNPSFTPTLWGDVPDRTIAGTELTTTAKVNLQNTSTPWVVGAPVKTIVTDTASGETARTVTNTFTYKSGTRELLTHTRLPGDAALNLTRTRTFTGNNLTSEALVGADVTSRSTTFGASYIQDRYPPSVTNAEGHATTLDWDLRFGAVDYLDDPDGKVTTVERDEFGRVVRTTEPDGTATTYSFERCDVVSCAAVTGAAAALRITKVALNGTTQVAPTQIRYLDVLGREVLSEVEALDPADGYRRMRTVFDNRARVQYVSKPYFSTQATPTCTVAGANCTWFTYEVRDRVTREDGPDGGYTTTTYTGAVGSVTVTTTETVLQPGASSVSRAKQSTFNVLAQLISTVDGYGASPSVTTTYDYTSHGDLDTVAVNGVSMASITYDLAGNRTQIVEPNTGTTAIDVDALGQLLTTTDAKGQLTTFEFDLIGRLTERVDKANSSPVTNTWTWDPIYGTGQLGARSRTGFTETYSYRASDSKLASVVTDVAVSGVLSASYTHYFGYDGAGRLSTVTFPNLTVTHAYSSRGYLNQYKSGSTVLHEFADTDAFGNVTFEKFYDHASQTLRTYDAGMGRLATLQTGTTATPKSVQDLEVVWRSNGAVYKRLDHRNTSITTDDYTDTFTYDSLERLTKQATTVGASRTLDFAYDVHGNFTSKLSNVTNDLDVTGYTYPYGAKPHRLTAVTFNGISNTLTYDSNGNLTQYNAATGDDTFLSFDGQNNVTKITVGATSGTTTPTARDEFWYDPDGQRFLGRESWNEGGTQKSRITTYLGAYEELVPASGSAYSKIQRIQVSPTVQFTRRTATGGAVTSFWRFLHRDHLGSVDAIADSAGGITEKTSFDPFGGRREKTWATDITTASGNTLLSLEDEYSPRGFTDHEQLNRTGFMHMNGRVYDPRIGRFVSADPIVQAPFFSQSYNRYSYTLNSPVSLVDPSGFRAKSDGVEWPETRNQPTLGEKGSGGGASSWYEFWVSNLEFDNFYYLGDEAAYVASSFGDFAVPTPPATGGPGTGQVDPPVPPSPLPTGISGGFVAEGSGQSGWGYFDAMEASLPMLDQDFVDTVVGFGDAFGAQTVRVWLGIEGGVDYESSAYLGGEVVGTAWSFGTGAGVSARGAAFLGRIGGGTRWGHWINHNRYLRFGPGRMPANGRLPAGPKVSRMSVGPQRTDTEIPHLDLRIRPLD